MVDVSIILVNYNTKELTTQCINSIFEKTEGISFEVIVIDNNSKDGSVELLSSDKRIVFVESGSNLGFGKANNLGVENSNGKYIFFLNSDTLLLNNAVKIMFDFMAENQSNLNIGALGSILLDGEYKRTHSYSSLPTVKSVLFEEWGDHILKRFGKRMPRLDEKSVDSDEAYFKVGYVTGADLFCSRDTINKAGGFDPDFFMYWEESEMQYRWAKKLKKFSYIIKTPQIVHLEGKSAKVSSSCFIKTVRRMPSMFLYFKKTLNPFAYFLFRVVMFVSRIHQFLLPKVTFSEKKMLLNVLCKKY